MSSNLRALLPQHKHDVERAKQLVALGYPAVAPILPELMEWLQDMNWPVAKVIAPFLATIGLPLVPLIRTVLATKDETWKYWVVSELVAESRPIFDAVEGEMWEIVGSAPENEDEAVFQERVREVLQSKTLA